MNMSSSVGIDFELHIVSGFEISRERAIRKAVAFDEVFCNLMERIFF